MEKIGVIKKTRKKYLYDNKFEIALDDVENIGLFIEVDTKRIDYDPKDEYNQLMNLLYKLHLDFNSIEKNNIVLNPYNSENNENGYAEVREKFFIAAIEKGQGKAKKLILEQYPRM